MTTALPVIASVAKQSPDNWNIQKNYRTVADSRKYFFEKIMYICNRRTKYYL